MSSTKSQVAVATNIPNLSSSSQQHKEYNTEESLGRQNSFGLNRRGNMKGKHLTRSHAMREATSPPRTPTPRTSESSSQMSPNGYQQQQQQQQQQQHMQQHADVNENNNSNNTSNNNKLHTQSAATRGNSPIIDTPTVIVTSQHKQQQQHHQQQQHTNVALCNEAEFPKLTPPKSKGGGGGGSGCSVNNNNGQQQQQQHQRINNANDGGHNNNNNCNKKTNGDTAGGAGVNETHNKGTNTNSGNTTKNYNQSQHQQQTQQQQQPPFNAGNALQKALNITDNSSSQATPIYNSPMNYQLHPNDNNSQQQQQTQQLQQPQPSFIVYDKENRCPRNDSQNSMNSNDDIHYDQHQQQHQSQSQQHHQRAGGGGKKHRTNSNSKGSKPRLKNMGGSSLGGGNPSNNGAAGIAPPGGAGGGCGGGGVVTSNSMDGSLNSSNNTSGFISRENSNEQYTDHGGTDLLSFFKETLNKNVKDRQFLLKVEKDLIEFVQEGSRGEIRFPQASSYNRMLIHRTAAFFGMEHNVDTETQQCVIVAPTKNTRIPEIRFKTLVIHNREDSRKSILKRDTHSFDEARQSSYLCPDRGGMLDRKAKSFEEREEDYDRARSRIFNRSQNEACGGGGNGGSTDDDNNYISWTSSVEQQQQQQQQQHFSRGRPSGKVLKIQNSPDGGRVGSVGPKSNNFGNYGGSTQQGAPLMRGDSTSSNKSGNGGTRSYSKPDPAGNVANTSWRLSPSSSGYKTQTQSVRSDSVTPSPTGGGYGSDEQLMPDNNATTAVIANRESIDNGAATSSSLPSSGLVWAVTDISNVPMGSILINPQTLQPILNADGTVYHYDPSNMPPTQAMPPTGGQGGGSVGAGVVAGIYHPSQTNNTPPQQQSMPNVMKKQHKGHQMPPQQQPQQQFSNIESTTTTNTGVGETVSESSTQTINVIEEVAICNSVGEGSFQDGDTDLCQQDDDNDECDNSANGCLSITTTTSTKNYDRIEVQKFKNQATSPNIPNNDKEETVKRELSQTPTNVAPIQQAPLLQQQPQPQIQAQTQAPTQPIQHRETPHSSRSTPFSSNDTLTKRSSEEPRTPSWTQNYQVPYGSTMFYATNTPNSSNPYCATTYQQWPDGSIYAVPQGMIYAYPPQVEGELQGYFMPVSDPSQQQQPQQRADTTSLLQPGTQAIYPTAGATTMVPVAAYPTAQFTTTNGTPIYPGQVIYSGEQFPTAGVPLATTAPGTAAAQLQQMPMTTYPIGYPYSYNGNLGYWGQTMTYYVPQQAVPASASLLTAPPPPLPPSTALTNGTHVAGGVVNASGPNGGNSTAGPSTNSSNTTNSSSGANGNVTNSSHPNVSATSGGYHQAHVGHLTGVANSSGGTTYYGTGRIKRPAPPHYAAGNGVAGGHQVLTATAPPNGVGAATYQLGHAVPTLTLAAAAPPQATAGGAPSSSQDLSGGAATATTMYALPQHATMYPANMFPYATQAAAPTIGQQTAGNMAQQPTLMQQQPGQQQGGHAASIGGHTNVAPGTIHNPHHSNTVITPFYTTTTHHHAPHPGMHAAGGHTIHVPGSAAIPIVDPTTLTILSHGGHANNAQIYTNRAAGQGGGIGSGGNGGSGNSQSAPSTPHSMPSSSILHHAQRQPSVFSTPPIMNNNGGGGNYNSSSNSTPHYYVSNDQSHQAPSIAIVSQSPHNSYVAASYEKRSNTGGGGGGKKPLSYQSASLSRQNSSNTGGGGGYNGNCKPPPLMISSNNNHNNDTRSSPGSGSSNSKQHSIKRSGGVINDNKPSQTALLSGPPSFAGNVNIVNSNSNNAGSSYQTGVEMCSGGNIPIVNVSKPPIRLNAAAAAFRQKGTPGSSGGGPLIEYRRNPASSQRNSPGTNATSSNDNSNNNSPNSIHNSSNAATPIAAGCYAAPPSYTMINAPNNGGGEPAPQPHPPSLYITTAPARGPAHIPPHLQNAAASGASATASQQAASAVLGAAAAADAANAAAVAAAAATVTHHHQPLLGTYNPGASGLYFKYGHTYFAHPSVALPNNRRSPSTDLRPPIAQMAGMYPTVNMMIPAQPRHPGRHPNPNYKGTRPR